MELEETWTYLGRDWHKEWRIKETAFYRVVIRNMEPGTVRIPYDLLVELIG